MQIKDKIAVVTGAGSGLGQAVSRELAAREVGAIALVDLDEKVRDCVDAVDAAAGRKVATAFVGNVTDADFRASVFDTMAEQGVVSIVVPAAGITRDALAVKVDRETGEASVYSVDHFRLVVEVNLIAPLYWAMEMVARIAADRKSKGLKRWSPDEGVQGTAIFIGSVSSQGNKGQISYSATKAGLVGASSTLMKEAMFHGVRTGVIHPGFCNTPMVQAMPEEIVTDKVLPFTQLQRLIEPQEIADAVCFMISNPAVTRELWADAGWHPSP